jgi:hypothetical protein
MLLAGSLTFTKWFLGPHDGQLGRQLQIPAAVSCQLPAPTTETDGAVTLSVVTI